MHFKHTVLYANYKVLKRYSEHEGGKRYYMETVEYKIVTIKGIKTNFNYDRISLKTKREQSETDNEVA